MEALVLLQVEEWWVLPTPVLQMTQESRVSTLFAEQVPRNYPNVVLVRVMAGEWGLRYVWQNGVSYCLSPWRIRGDWVCTGPLPGLPPGLRLTIRGEGMGRDRFTHFSEMRYTCPLLSLGRSQTAGSASLGSDLWHMNSTHEEMWPKE